MFGVNITFTFIDLAELVNHIQSVKEPTNLKCHILDLVLSDVFFHKDNVKIVNVHTAIIFMPL